MTMTDRERDAIELLDRIYERKADHILDDPCMVIDWMDDEIASFIRKHGSFAELLQTEKDLPLKSEVTFFTMNGKDYVAVPANWGPSALEAILSMCNLEKQSDG